MVILRQFDERDIVPVELEFEYFIDCVEDGGIFYWHVDPKGIKNILVTGMQIRKSSFSCLKFKLIPEQLSGQIQ